MRVDTMHKQGAANIFQAPYVRPIFKQFERSVDIDDMLEWQQNRVRTTPRSCCLEEAFGRVA
jgi:hypothetical protein